MTTTQRTVDVTPHLAQHIVEKDHVGVVLDNGLEKGLVSFVRRNVQGRRVVQDPLQLFQDFGGIHPRLLELKVSPPYVNRIKLLGSSPCSIGNSFANGRDDASGSALNFVNVPHMIPDKAFHPQVLLPILKEQKGVKVNEEPGGIPVLRFDSLGKVQPLRLLEFRRVLAQVFSAGVHFLEAFQWRRVDGVGLSNVVFVGGKATGLGLDLGREGCQIFGVLFGAAGRKGGDAVVGIPVQEVLSALFAHPELELLEFVAGGTVPVRSHSRRVNGRPRGVQDVSHDTEFQEFLGGDDVQANVFVADAFHVKKMIKAKLALLSSLLLVNEVHALVGWQNQRSSHGKGNGQHGFCCTSQKNWR